MGLSAQQEPQALAVPATKANRDPVSQTFRLRKPCSNCPFLKSGAIELRPGRLDQIVSDLVANDHSSFICHKTLSRRGHDNESMCAGAATYLAKVGRPNIQMRLATAFGVDVIAKALENAELVIDAQPVKDLVPDPPKTVKLWANWTGDPPVIGAWIRPDGPRSRVCYQILKASPARRAGRFNLVCAKHPRDFLDTLPSGTRVYHWTWAPRTPTRRRASPLL